MGRAQPCADFFFGKKMGGKRWGLLCSAFFTRKIFPAADRRDYELKNQYLFAGAGRMRGARVR